MWRLWICNLEWIGLCSSNAKLSLLLIKAFKGLSVGLYDDSE
jgi:hypothetical protein